MQLLRLVGNMSSATVDGPRDFPRAMAERLQQIADQNGGEVPLHGRLFSEWLHFAFPNECPYPHMVEESKALTPPHWLDKKVSVDPVQRIQLAATESEESKAPVESITWTSKEVLHVYEEPPKLGLRSRLFSIFTFRTLMQVALLLAVLRAATSNWQSLCRSLGAGKEKDCYLPF